MDREAPPGRLESLYILIALLLVTRALEPLLYAGSTSSNSLSDSNPAVLLSALAVYTVAILFLMRRPSSTLETLRNNFLLIAVSTLPLISTFWSVEPGTTFRRAVALLMTGLFCVYIARRLSPEEFLRRLLLALFIGGIASLLYTAVFPQFAIEHSLINTGSWKGVYGHKAILGRIAAVAVLVSIYVRPKFRWERVIRWLTVAIFLFLSIKSQSRASWLMMGGGLGFVVILAVLRNRTLSNGIKLSIALVMAFTILAVVAMSFNTVLADVGRDPTFSGRTTLWQGAIAVGKAQHPILGAGYKAFWTEKGAAGVRDYIQDWARLPGHGHNGYLDVWLDLGIPGVILFAVFLVVTATRLARRLLREPHEPAWAAFSIFFFIFILNNGSVTVAFEHTDIAWIFALLAGLYTRGCVTARSPVSETAKVPRGVRTVPPAPAYGRAVPRTL